MYTINECMNEGAIYSALGIREVYREKLMC